MQTRHFEIGILGQGLAGTTLAWSLHRRGRKVCLIDPHQSETASRIAAGLMTPVTGPKLAKTWEWDRCRTLAERFYRDVEQLSHSQSKFFQIAPALHLFRSPEEQQRYEQRLQSSEFHGLIRSPNPEILDGDFIAPWGGFEMPTACRLDVPRYLEVSRDYFRQSNQHVEAFIDVDKDLLVSKDDVRIPRLNLCFDRFFFCQGYVPDTHAWFGRVRFNPAKGEILSLHIPEFTEQRPVHRGVWIAPRSGNESLVGSTFEWKQLDTMPTPAARESLLSRLSEFLRSPVEVTGQRAAVRPTMHDFKPAMGFHPENSRLGILNGLGTKGSLMAPWLAERLSIQLENPGPLPPELDVQRWFR